MSQKGTRKSQNAISEDKEKRTDSPVKEMKKKMAANAEKEKQATEKSDKPAEKIDKPADKSNKPADKNDKTTKPTEKNDKTTKPAEKPVEKQADRSTEKQDKNEKQDKQADKKPERNDSKKPEKPVEKPQEKKEDSKGDKNAKEKPSKVNGHNGAEANGADHSTVSDDSSDDLVIEEDEVFPELTYDDSDNDAFEADASRSLTRRSQVKVTKTPETPRPVSDKDTDDSKESKVLKLSETPTSDRKLRSADSPKPEAKKTDSHKKTAEPNKEGQDEKPDSTKKDEMNKLDVEVVELDNEGESRSKTRARVSPYSRQKLDVTVSSVAANYTGNNTTMEMDITESSIVEETLDDSGYLRGLRGIRGRSSYKSLADLPALRKVPRNVAANVTLPEFRPTVSVVGRKRKPSEEHIEVAEEATDDGYSHSVSKRIKLFDRLSLPFRKNAISRRAAEIVGINTDLPLTAPIASPLDPETMKPPPQHAAPSAPLPAPDTQGNRCSIM